MAILERFDDNEPGGTVRAKINTAIDELRHVERPWAAPFDGDRCTYGGKSYDYVTGGNRNDVPSASPQSWRERVVDIPTAGGDQVTATGFTVGRGTYDQLLALPANHGLDMYIVEGEQLGRGDHDPNGDYRWRLLPTGGYGWVQSW